MLSNRSTLVHDIITNGNKSKTSLQLQRLLPNNYHNQQQISHFRQFHNSVLKQKNTKKPLTFERFLRKKEIALERKLKHEQLKKIKAKEKMRSIKEKTINPHVEEIDVAAKSLNSYVKEIEYYGRMKSKYGVSRALSILKCMKCDDEIALNTK